MADPRPLDRSSAQLGVAGLTLVVALVYAGAATAQISPGPLAAPHAELEGSTRCLDCHTPREGVSAAKCLDCHGALAARISAGQGLHAREGSTDCQTCHVDHHGRDFELIWWGDDGIAAFDHRRTGSALEGAHARLGCRDCHRPELLQGAAELAAGNAAPGRTFLGLGTACLDCHRDEHRAQLATRSCTDCHSQAAWTPTHGFDHGTTSFPLSGAHQQVACGECHPRVAQLDEHSARPAPRGGPIAPAGAATGVVRFSGVAFASCSDCHRDPHAGRLGVSCASCHTTSGWRSLAMTSSFDHDRTRFALVGAHRRLECAVCHGPAGGAAFRRPAFADCTDCHLDVHLGQFRDRPDRGACTACHDQETFRPARFGLGSHDETSYPLTGAHLAVPCLACHRPLSDPQVARLARSTGIDRARLRRELGGHPPLAFDLAHAACTDCHDDPHRGEVDRFVSLEGCPACHSDTRWRPAAFDHDESGWPLAGKHRQVACAECHPPLTAAAGAAPRASSAALAFTATPTDCAGCHDDPHLGQLADASGRAACARCHLPEGWRPAIFDHQRDARFRLEGAHRALPCTACHREEQLAAGSAVRYKPLPLTCEGCHAQGTVGLEAAQRRRR